MRFDSSDPFFAAPAAGPAPATRRRLRRPVDPAPPQSPLNYQPFPAWACVDVGAQEDGLAALFAAGAGLALLDGFLRQNPPCVGALRNRLALKAAAASARLLRLREDEAALRDAEHLAAVEDPGPAGRLHRVWRGLAGQAARLDAKRIGEALRLLDAPDSGELGALVGELQELANMPGDPITLAAQAAACAYYLCPSPEGEVLALWTADLLLALRLRWERPVPLLITKILDPSLRRGPSGGRLRPNDSPRFRARRQVRPGDRTIDARRDRTGPSCNLDDLLTDLADELRARPYDLVFVAGGYQLATRPRFADAIRAVNAGTPRGAGLPELTPTELLAVTAIAYLQPATRAQISQLAGKDISRDVIGALKRHGLIDGSLRAPEPGAPFAYVTTKRFLEVSGLASLRHLPDIERLEDEGLLQRPQSDADLDGVLGLREEEAPFEHEANE